MKNLRQELIDYTKWLSEKRVNPVIHLPNLIVGYYLKSINSNASPKSRNVRTNEHQEKDCGSCKYGQCIDPCVECDEGYSHWEQSV